MCSSTSSMMMMTRRTKTQMTATRTCDHLLTPPLQRLLTRKLLLMALVLAGALMSPVTLRETAPTHAQNPAVPRSGGAEVHSTAHGSQASQTWKLSGGLRAIVEDLTDNVILPSRGANSGVSRAMLLAGRTAKLT
jgi:hypothetical protein